MRFQEHDVVLHVRSATEYEIVGTPRTFRLENTGEPAYAYRRADRMEDVFWVRSQALMEDGRFVFVRRQDGFTDFGSREPETIPSILPEETENGTR